MGLGQLVCIVLQSGQLRAGNDTPVEAPQRTPIGTEYYAALLIFRPPTVGALYGFPACDDASSLTSHWNALSPDDMDKTSGIRKLTDRHGLYD